VGNKGGLDDLKKTRNSGHCLESNTEWSSTESSHCTDCNMCIIRTLY